MFKNQVENIFACQTQTLFGKHVYQFIFTEMFPSLASRNLYVTLASPLGRLNVKTCMTALHMIIVNFTEQGREGYSRDPGFGRNTVRDLEKRKIS